MKPNVVYAAVWPLCSISARTSSVTATPKDSIVEICSSSMACCAKSVVRSKLPSTAMEPAPSARIPTQRGSTSTRSNVSRGDVRMPKTRAPRPRGSRTAASDPFPVCMKPPFYRPATPRWPGVSVNSPPLRDLASRNSVAPGSAAQAAGSGRLPALV